jgi:hypothetical protein
MCAYIEDNGGVKESPSDRVAYANDGKREAVALQAAELRLRHGITDVHAIHSRRKCGVQGQGGSAGEQDRRERENKHFEA